MLAHLTPRSLARAPFRVAVSAATALALCGAGGFMALPKSYDAGSAVEPQPIVVSTAPAAPAAAPMTSAFAQTKPADLTCLTKAVYYEARGESPEGQAAVAQVVLNRTHRPSYPSNVCGVVFQGVKQGGCQFSFACDGAMRRPLETAAWTRARRVASNALSGHVMRAVGQAISFHVVALGSEGRNQITRIGGHVFYMPGRARPGVAFARAAGAARMIAAAPVTTPITPSAATVARDASATAPTVVVASNEETAPAP